MRQAKSIFGFTKLLALFVLIYLNLIAAEVYAQSETTVREFVTENPEFEQPKAGMITDFKEGKGFQDGPGPSNIFSLGKYFIVFDPWNFTVTINDTTDSSKRTCKFPSDFRPWRSYYTPENAVVVVSEPIFVRRKVQGDFLQPKSFIKVSDKDLEKAFSAGDCVFNATEISKQNPIPKNQLSVLRETIKKKGEGKIAFKKLQLKFSGSKNDVTLKSQNKDGLLYSVRQIGSFADGEKAISWTEILSDPPQTGPKRVRTAVYAAVIKGDGSIDQITQIITASPNLGNSKGSYSVVTPSKFGFEFITAFNTDNAPKLAIMKQKKYKPKENTNSANHRQESSQYIYTTHPFKNGKIEIFEGNGTLDDPVKDRVIACKNETHCPTDMDSGDGFMDFAPESEDGQNDNGSGQVEKTTRNSWRTSAIDYVIASWKYSEETTKVPSEMAAEKIYIDGNGNDGWWMRPRQLVFQGNGVTNNVGVAYSYGGSDSVKDFKLKVKSSANTKTPIGHIKDTLKLESDQKYPAGIDCSNFVNRVFGSSGSTTQITSIEKGAPKGLGEGWKLVDNLNSINPGDVIVRKGHIVIFDNWAVYGADPVNFASYGMRVIEATSRCGKVCFSIYDPSFFEGWFIYRKADLSTKIRKK